jgi:hypothetical protein
MDLILDEINTNQAYWEVNIFLINGPIDGVDTEKNKAFYKLIQAQIRQDPGSAWLIYNALFPNKYPSLNFLLQHLNVCYAERSQIIALY